MLDVGGKRLRFIATPHVPHGWEAGVFFEETTNTLLCGDLFGHPGNGPAVTEADLVGPAMEAEELFGFSSLSPTTGGTLRKLATLEPATLEHWKHRRSALTHRLAHPSRQRIIFLTESQSRGGRQSRRSEVGPSGSRRTPLV